jgi:hypothetical protein
MRRQRFGQVHTFVWTTEILCAAVIALALAGFALIFLTVRPVTQVSADEIPAHHASAPKAALPDTVDPKQFQDGLTQNSYAMAAKIKTVLYEQPCYCFCDKADGHTDLLDCFTSNHASMCNICRMEAIFAYEQTRKGQSPGQIRKAIIRGDWKKLNPRDYDIVRDLPN